MPRAVATLLLSLTVVGLSADPARAQQALGLNVGYFALRGEDGRITDDVLVENLNFLAFELSDFNNATIGGEYLVGLGDYLEAGVGASFYRRTVPTVYNDFVDIDGTEIDQDLKLRIVPVTATIRVLPLGRRAGVQPYVGAGVSWLSWRYSETGEFVDLRDLSIFRDSFVDDGTVFGPVGLAGIRVPVGPDFAIGGEFRYQGGQADLGPGFLTERIDLGGYVAQATFQFRF